MSKALLPVNSEDTGPYLYSISIWKLHQCLIGYN